MGFNLAVKMSYKATNDVPSARFGRRVLSPSCSLVYNITVAKVPAGLKLAESVSTDNAQLLVTTTQTQVGEEDIQIAFKSLVAGTICLAVKFPHGLASVEHPIGAAHPGGRT